MVAVVTAVEIVVLGVTIMVTVIAVITWNLQIDWGHLLNRQRDCSPSDIRSLVSEARASIIQREKKKTAAEWHETTGLGLFSDCSTQDLSASESLETEAGTSFLPRGQQGP